MAAPSDDADVLRSRNALLAGTTVVSGTARALVVATGMRTEFGRIARLAQATEEAPSPLQRELTVLSRVIAMRAVLAGILVFVIGEWLGVSRWANFVFAIGIIVANVPEGRPAPDRHARDGDGLPSHGSPQCAGASADERGVALRGVRRLHGQDRHADRESYGRPCDLSLGRHD